MIQVGIKNFQSIKNIKFPLEGFTVIVGKNNIGKSAVVRAIDAALSNKSGTDFIRSGEKKTEVSLNSDAISISWKKSDTASYIVNKEDFSKLNRAVPQPIIDAGFRRLEIGDQKLSPLFASQFEPLFLLDKGGSAITEVLSTMYRLNVISKADDLCQKELRASKSLNKTRAKDLEKVKADLEVFEGFEDIKKEIEELTYLETQCNTLREELLYIETFQQRRLQIDLSIKKLLKIKSIKFPDAGDYQAKVQELQEIQSYYDRVVSGSTSVKILKEAQEAPIPEYGQVEGEISNLSDIVEYTENLRKIAQSFKRQKELLKILQEIDPESASQLGDSFETLKDIENKGDVFERTVGSVKSFRGQLEALDEDLKKEQEALAEFKNCPTCGKPL